MSVPSNAAAQIELEDVPAIGRNHEDNSGEADAAGAVDDRDPEEKSGANDTAGPESVVLDIAAPSPALQGDKVPLSQSEQAKLSHSQQALLQACAQLGVFPDAVCSLIAVYHAPRYCDPTNGGTTNAGEKCQTEAIPPFTLCIEHRCGVPSCQTPCLTRNTFTFGASKAFCEAHQNRLYAVQSQVRSRHFFASLLTSLACVAMGLAATREAVTRASFPFSSDELTCFAVFFVPFLVLAALFLLMRGLVLCCCARTYDYEKQLEALVSLCSSDASCCTRFRASFRLLEREGLVSSVCAFLNTLCGISLPWLIMGAQSLSAATSLDDKLTSSDAEAQALLVVGAVVTPAAIAAFCYESITRNRIGRNGGSLCPNGAFYLLALCRFVLHALPTILCGLLSRSSPRTAIHAFDVPIIDDLGTAFGYSFIVGAGCFAIYITLLLVTSRFGGTDSVAVLLMFICAFAVIPVVPSLLTVPALYLGHVHYSEKDKFLVGVILSYIALFTCYFVSFFVRVFDPDYEP